MVCYDLTGWPGERPWSVECTSSEANLPRIAQNRKLAAMAGGDEKKMEELVAAAAKDGTRVMSEVGSMWYNFRGNDEATRHPAHVHRHAELHGEPDRTAGGP